MRRPRTTRPHRLANLLAAAGFAAVLFGCAGVSELNPAAAPVLVRLKLGEEIQLQSWDRVKFLRVIGDSRCPVGAQCVWAGAAQAEVSVTTRAGTVANGELTVSPDTTHSKSVDLGKYRIWGMQLDPYPKKDQTVRPSDYQLSLRIEMAPR